MKRDEQIVTIEYDESSYREGDRHLAYTLVGTRDQIADRVRDIVHVSLGYGSHVTGLKIIPVNPVNVQYLSDR